MDLSKGIFLVVGFLCTAIAAIAERPNIVLMVIDDLGFADVGFRNNGQISTPNLDGIARRGAELKNYYVHSVCSPSRAALFTGRFSHHTGVHHIFISGSNTGLGLDEVLLSDKMQSAGYSTHLVGKWHLGLHKWAYTPGFRGFDSYFGYLCGGGDYFMGFADMVKFWFMYIEQNRANCSSLDCVRIPWEVQTKYSTEVYAEKATGIIERHAEQNSSKPLFLTVTFQGVHSAGFQPNEVPPKYVEPFLDSLKPGQRRQFAGMLAAVDFAIGNISAALERNGFTEENTLLIVTTDNGGPVFSGDSCGSRNTPLRGGKHTLFEGGVRGTAFLSGFGVLQGVYDGLMHITDWYATLADVAGYNLETKLPLDSVSHWDLLSGNALSTSSVRSELVLGNASGFGFGMIVDINATRWKIVQGSPGVPDKWSKLDEDDQIETEASLKCPGDFCLFDLTNDPEERHEVAGLTENANVLKKLKRRLEEELKTFRNLQPDCDLDPIPKWEEHVGHAWYPYCDGHHQEQLRID